jgi:L-ribulose-5-phosphate 3-epimerase
MRHQTRREFLIAGAAAAGGLSWLAGCDAGRSAETPAPGLSGFRVGVTDWNLRRSAELDAVEMAARIGFDGVEVTFGNPGEEGRLPLDDPDRQAEYLEAFRRHGIQAAGTHLGILHTNRLKDRTDPLGRKWVADAIPVTRALETRVILVPFFGAGALETPQEMDYVADIMRELAPEAQNHGVILGLENTLSAEDNMRILERADSPAVQVYYDVGNSHGNRYDIYNEIRWLGREHICQFHLKDNPHYLGEGAIDFLEVMRAIEEIGFEGFGNLETSAPSDDVEADMRRNLAFVRERIALV